MGLGVPARGPSYSPLEISPNAVPTVLSSGKEQISPCDSHCINMQAGVRAVIYGPQQVFVLKPTESMRRNVPSACDVRLRCLLKVSCALA